MIESPPWRTRPRKCIADQWYHTGRTGARNSRLACEDHALLIAQPRPRPLMAILTPRGGGRSVWSGSGAGERSRRWTRRSARAGAEGWRGRPAGGCGWDGSGAGSATRSSRSSCPTSTLPVGRDPVPRRIGRHRDGGRSVAGGRSDACRPHVWAEQQSGSRIQAEALVDLAAHPRSVPPRSCWNRLREHLIASLRG